MNKNLSFFIFENLISHKKENLEIDKYINMLEFKNKDNIWDFNNIMFELNFKFLNTLWNNSTGYIKINEDIYWMENHYWESSDCNLDYWVNHIRFIVKKNEIKNDKIKLTFGIKTNLNLQRELSRIENCKISFEKFDIINNNILEFSNFRLSTQ